MKRFCKGFAVGILVLLCGCGGGEKDTTINIETGTDSSTSVEILVSSEEDAAENANAEADEKADKYVGEYNDYDVNEPKLEIAKKEDGTYTIQIEIYRLAFLDDGIGTVTDEGITFSATAPYGSAVEGVIMVENEIATVIFKGEEWSSFADISEFQYYKTSDTPNIYVPGAY